jgi:glycosyltransferase involved in cell wall biosynthesis
LPEVGGDAVLYISGKDENETRDKLLQLYDDEKLRMNLRQKGLKRAKEFDWQKTDDIVINAVVKTYEENKNE